MVDSEEVALTIPDNESGFMDTAIEFGLGLMMLGIFGGIGLGVFFNTNTTTWDAGLVTIWNYVPYVVVAGIMIGAVYAAKMRKG